MSQGAPIGNQFWKERSKHGRDKIFATPKLFWEEACAYFESIDNNPFYKIEAKTINIGDFQSKVELAKLPVMKPYTIQGLCRYLDTNTHYFNELEESVKGKEDEASKEYSAILTRVREIIYEQKFSGAAANFFNAMIISRDLSLKETADVNHSGVSAGPIMVEIVRSSEEE